MKNAEKVNKVLLLLAFIGWGLALGLWVKEDYAWAKMHKAEERVVEAETLVRDANEHADWAWQRMMDTRKKYDPESLFSVRIITRTAQAKP